MFRWTYAMRMNLYVMNVSILLAIMKLDLGIFQLMNPLDCISGDEILLESSLLIQ